MMSIKITFFWDVLLRNLAESSRRFGETCSFHANVISHVQHSSTDEIYNFGKQKLIFCVLTEQYNVIFN